MNTHITQLGDAALILKTKSLATEERKLVNEVLHHLREIDRRRLYAARGYDSLFSFTVKELGYSDASAARRIGAMRLLAGLPAAASQDIEKSLSTGELNLSHLSKVQGFLRTERKEKKRIYTVAEKTQLIASLKSKSTRDAERVLSSVSPDSMRRKDVARPLSETETLVQFTADAALMAKLTRVREVLSHRLPDASMSALLHQMGDLVLKAADPLRPMKSGPAKKAAKKTIVPKSSPAHERLLWSGSPAQERLLWSDSPAQERLLWWESSCRSASFGVNALRRRSYYRSGRQTRAPFRPTLKPRSFKNPVALVSTLTPRASVAARAARTYRLTIFPPWP